MYRFKSIYNQGDSSHTSYQLISKHISFCLLTASSPLLANPTGGDVVGGSATIDYGTTTVITQQTNKAIVNWQDFSVDQHETTQFVQPSSSSVILNRVVGNNASQIMGKLQSNGTVFLVNPHGIVFGKDAVVDVGGLVASTASISNQHFMEGNYQFMDAPDNSSVINQGRITVAQTGYAALVAPNVENSGVIEATLGQVTLASGKAFTVDLYGDNLITLDATAMVESAQVRNSGVILADGGTVSMSAAGADSVVESLINMDGYVQAQSVGVKNGKVVLKGNDNTTIKIAGKIDVSGKKQHEKGGTVQATAKNVNIEAGSSIDASGNQGGGTVHMGGEYQGGGSLAHAQYLSMDDNAIIDASAINNGNGGEVILWSDLHTIMNGQIISKGGALSGDGGLVETSSKIKLDFVNARINTQALNGKNGTWLIDPTEITVDNTYAATLSANLGFGNVTIQTSSAGNDVEFTNTNAVTFSANTFTVMAHNDIIINSGATVINNSGAGATNLRADLDGAGGGTITFTSGNIASPGLGEVNFYYNPSSYATPTNYLGNVTDVNPTAYMLVNDATDLQDINSNLAGSYALNNIIDVNDVIADFTSIGGEGGAPFTGIFTGTVIDTTYGLIDLDISAAGLDNVGLFGYIDGATLRDIGITNATISGASNVGGIIGSAVNSTLTGAFNISSGTITATGDKVGGLIGNTQNTSFSGEFFNTNLSVDGINGVGGIIGYVDSGTIFTSALNMSTTADAATVTINGGGDNVGGLIGYVSDDNLTFEPLSLSTNVLNAGVINVTGGSGCCVYSGGNNIGGLIGLFDSVGTMTSSNPGAMSNMANVTAYLYAGGIFGSLLSTSFNTSNDLTNAANISGNDVGGIVGRMEGGTFSGNITVGDLTLNSYVLTANNYLGGVAGFYTGSSSNIDLDNITINTNTAFSSGSSSGGVIGYLDASVGNPTLTGTFSTFDLTGPYGAIIGEINGATNFSSNITNATNLTSLDNMGGVVGIIKDSTISGNFANTASIVGSSLGGPNAGGVAGSITNSTIDGNLTNSGDVSAAAGSYTMGGIAAFAQNSTINGAVLATGGNIINSGNGPTGGLFGLVNGTVFGSGASLSFNAITPSSVSTNNPTIGGVGGLIGRFDHDALSIPLSVTGDVTVSGETKVGGLIGISFNPGGGIISSNMINEATVISSGNYAGGIYGRNINSPDVFTGNISNSGAISGFYYVGGLFGQLETSSFNTGTLTNTGTVTGTSNVGGIIGRLTGAGTVVSNMNNTGEITGGDQTGGLVGLATGGVTFSGTGSSGGGINTVTEQGYSVGGLFGEINNSTISGSYHLNNGVIKGLGDVGGVIGLVTNSSTLDTTAVIFTNTGFISGTSNVGGLIGNLDGSTNYAATGAFENDAIVFTSAPIDSIGGIFGTMGNLTIGNDLANYGNIMGDNAIGLGGIMGLLSTGEFTGSLINAANVSGSSATRVGGLFGSMTGGTISGSSTFQTTALFSTTTISGANYVGGLIGEISGGTFTRTTASVNNNGAFGVQVSGVYSLGGLFGQISGSPTFTPTTLTNSSSFNSVTGTGDAVGGIIGLISFSTPQTLATHMDNTGNITGMNYVGGSIGFVTGNTVNFTGNLSNTGNVTGSETGIGGIIGQEEISTGSKTYNGTYTNSGNITGTSLSANFLGGIIGGSLGGAFGDSIGSSDVVLWNTGTIYAPNYSYVGGVIGFSYYSSYNSDVLLKGTAGNVTALNYSGGLIGTLVSGPYYGALELTYASPGTISGTQERMGGLVGSIYTDPFSPVAIFSPVSIVATGDITVSGGDSVGGLIGDAYNSVITLPTTFTNTFTVIGTGNYVGGVIGRLSSDNIGNYTDGSMSNTGSVTGVNDVGGVIGYIVDGAVLSDTYTHGTGTVTGNSNVGGVFGYFDAGTLDTTAILSTTSGDVTGTSNVGGLVGNLGVTTYSAIGAFNNAANVTATSDAAGGIFGTTSLTGITIANNLSNSGTITGSGFTFGTGGIAPTVTNLTFSGSLSNTGSVTGSSFVGGIFGKTVGSTLSGTFQSSTGTISGNLLAGGIAGYADSSTLSGSFTQNSGTVNATTSAAGGLFGAIGNGSTISAAATMNILGGSVTGGNNLGGLAGNVLAGNTWSATNTFANAATITGTGSNIGGLFGNLGDTLNNPLTNTGSVTGNNSVGGIAGNIDAAGGLNQAQMTSGTVTGNAQVGGIVGTNTGIITDALFGGILGTTGGSPIEFGGIAGNNTGTITNTLAVGTYNTSAATDVGALVGNNAGTVNTSYYDTRLFSTAIGTGNAGGTGYSTNLDFYTQSSYIGFSFPAIWTLSGTSYYASLNFCGVGCQILLPVPPTPPAPPTPTPSLSGNTASGIVTTIANNQTTNMVNPISFDLTSLNVNNFMNQFGDALNNLGLLNSFLNNVVILQTYTGSSDLSQTEIAEAAEAELNSIVEALSSYYCGSKSGG